MILGGIQANLHALCTWQQRSTAAATHVRRSGESYSSTTLPSFRPLPILSIECQQQSNKSWSHLRRSQTLSPLKILSIAFWSPQKTTASCLRTSRTSFHSRNPGATFEHLSTEGVFCLDPHAWRWSALRHQVPSLSSLGITRNLFRIHKISLDPSDLQMNCDLAVGQNRRPRRNPGKWKHGLNPSVVV